MYIVYSSWRSTLSKFRLLRLSSIRDSYEIEVMVKKELAIFCTLMVFSLTLSWISTAKSLVKIATLCPSGEVQIARMPLLSSV